MKTYSFLIASLLFVGLANCATAAPEATDSLYDDSPGLSFRFDARQSGDHASRVYSSQIALSGDVLYIYATMSMGPANPIRLVDGHPEWRPEGSTSAAAPPDTDQETALGEQLLVLVGLVQFFLFIVFFSGILEILDTLADA